MSVKAFWLEPIPHTYRFSLRRFVWSADSKCPKDDRWGHDASVTIGDVGPEKAPSLVDGHPVCGDRWPHDDPRWPTKCSGCGFAFRDSDEWQFNARQLYLRGDTGAVMTLADAPPGAIWNAYWMVDRMTERGRMEWIGPDGRCLVARLPDGHDWMIDSRANNCDSPCSSCSKPYHAHKDAGHPYVDARPHKCWVRHGEPPNLHVDKNGVTCGAGAGSILTSKWHGFLHNGHFVG